MTLTHDDYGKYLHEILSTLDRLEHKLEKQSEILIPDSVNEKINDISERFTHFQIFSLRNKARNQKH